MRSAENNQSPTNDQNSTNKREREHRQDVRRRGSLQLSRHDTDSERSKNTNTRARKESGASSSCSSHRPALAAAGVAGNDFREEAVHLLDRVAIICLDNDVVPGRDSRKHLIRGRSEWDEDVKGAYIEVRKSGSPGLKNTTDCTFFLVCNCFFTSGDEASARAAWRWGLELGW